MAIDSFGVAPSVVVTQHPRLTIGGTGAPAAPPPDE